MPEPATLAMVADLLGRYAVWVDFGRRPVEFAELFTSDGEFELPDGRRARGREGIASLIRSVLVSASSHAAPVRFVRHHLTTWTSMAEHPDSIEIRAYFMVVTDRGLDHWGHWSDRIQVTGPEAWRFRERIVTVEGTVADSWFEGLTPAGEG
jgi:hypothetical protein